MSRLVRPATLGEVQQVTGLCRTVMCDTYGQWAPMEQALAFADDIYNPDQIAARCQDPACLLLVATTPDGVVIGAGHACLDWDENGADSYLGGLYVDRAARGWGIGSQLMDKSLLWLAENGARLTTCGVAEQNDRVLASFHRRGFEAVDCVPGTRMPNINWVQLTGRPTVVPQQRVRHTASA